MTQTPRRIVPSATAAMVALSMLALAAVSAVLLPPRLALVSVALGAAMLVIAVIDWDRLIIPDWLSLPAIPLGLLASGSLVHDGMAELVVSDHVAGAMAGASGLWLVAWLYRRWRGRDGLGLGDVKLAAAAGAWVGMEHLSVVLLIAAGGALLLVLAATIKRGESLDRQAVVPFGAFLAPSIWLVWLLMSTGHLQ